MMSGIPAEVFNIAAFVFVMTCWVLVPLVPTILIYRLFPNNTIVVSGPFSGLTVKATGAFAGYLIVFFLMYPQLGKVFEEIKRSKPESWVLSGDVELRGPNGERVSLNDYQGQLVIDRQPPLQEVDNYGRIEVKVPLALGGEHPRIVVKVPNFGSAKIDPNEQNELEKRDDLNKKIKLKPIIIIQESKTTQDAVSSQKRVDQRPIDSSVLPKRTKF